jgi:predicted alpha-1,6-mannanase (GH76 family)
MFLDWALRTWNWFDKSGLVNSQHLIINGFEQWPPTWTYIQGVILGALCDISTITGEITYRMRAQTIADSVLSSSSGLVRSDGILQEFKTEEDPSIYYQDGYQFKGIFIRNLAYLFESTNDPKYKDFIETNVRAVLKSRNSFNQYGKSWYARLYKDDHPDFARQTSAIDCLNAALTVLGPTWAP